MVDTPYAVPLDKPSRVAAKHSRYKWLFAEQPRRPLPATPTAPFMGEGRLYSTAQDYGKFVRMLLKAGILGARENPE
jgi:CubicO group peptidase (beta-lactamase class C family)